MAKLLEQISGEEALKILRLLSAQDQDIENRIEELAENTLKDVNLEEISEEVLFNLDKIEFYLIWQYYQIIHVGKRIRHATFYGPQKCRADWYQPQERAGLI